MNPKTKSQNIKLLQDVFDESTRLKPLLLTMIDDLQTESSRLKLLGCFVNQMINKNPSKNIILVMLGTNERKFFKHSGIKLKPNIQILNLEDLNDDIDNFECALKSKLLSIEAEPNVDSVLIFDSINSIVALFDENLMKSTKRLARFLQTMQGHFDQIVLTINSDIFPSSQAELLEASLLQTSNVKIDFRTANDNKNNNSISSTDQYYSCTVATKKKHPRTTWQYDERVQHFRQNDSGTIVFIDQDHLPKKHHDSQENQQPQPQSSFRLTLTKEEQEARENLILPYIKKNNQNASENSSSVNIKSKNTDSSSDSANTGDKSSSTIIYTYDKFDDFDDEDPDDDLDF